MKFAYLSWEAFATLFTGLVALGGAIWLGTRQTRIQLAQVKLLEVQSALHDLEVRTALFDRRLEVYSATRDVLNELISTTRFPEQNFPAFLGAIEIGRLLFSDEVIARLESLRSELVDYGHLIIRMDEAYQNAGHYGSDGEVSRKYEVLEDFYKVRFKLREVFGPELALRT
jgi:hypothetical protein